MPPYRRHFPVTQVINSDHELWELTGTCGDRSLRVWLEILSIAERADGCLPNPSPTFHRSLAYLCRVSVQTSVKVWSFAVQHLWITQGSPPTITNYWKYHKRRETVGHSKENITGSLLPTYLPTDLPKDEESDLPEPSAVSKKQEPEWSEVATRLYRSGPRFKALYGWINGQRAKYTDAQIRRALVDFEAFERQAGPVDDWFPYLVKCLGKIVVNGNVRSAVTKHEEQKRKEKEWAHSLKKISDGIG